MGDPKRLAVLGVTLAMLAIPGQGSAAGTPVIVSGPGGHLTTYTQPVAVVQRGDEVTFVNADALGLHDVVSEQSGPDDADHCFARRYLAPALGQPWKPSAATFKLDEQGNKVRLYSLGSCPMLFTVLMGVGERYPIEGVGNVVPGTIYDYFCSIHGNMAGKLVVAPV